MSEDVRACPLCGSNRSRFFEQRNFRDRCVTYRVCRDCGLVYQSPRMTEAEAAVFYAEEYRLLYEGSADPTDRNVIAQRARADSLRGFISPLVAGISRHFDIGCSLGILLQHFQDAWHNQAVGVEPGEAHRTRARKEGLRVYSSLEDLEKAGEARFDLVTMSHVLEHLPYPVEYLNHLREAVLMPDGWLLLEVPNLYAHDSFEVAHLTVFSQHTLREVLCKSGFTIVKIEQHGKPSSDLFPLFLTVLCRPDANVDSTVAVRPEKWVGLKRRLGMLWRRLMGRLFPRWAWKEL